MGHLEYTNEYNVINPINGEILRSFSDIESANKFKNKHNDNLIIEYSTNKEIVDKLNQKYDGYLVYTVSFINDIAITEQGTDFDYNNTALLEYISADTNFVSIIAKSEEDAIQKAIDIRTKYLNKEPINIIVLEL